MLRKMKSILSGKKDEFLVYYNEMDNNSEKLFDFAEIFLRILGKETFHSFDEKSLAFSFGII